MFHRARDRDDICRTLGFYSGIIWLASGEDASEDSELLPRYLVCRMHTMSMCS